MQNAANVGLAYAHGIMVCGAIIIAVAGPLIYMIGHVSNWQELSYFSYVTLTSVGYGNILPVKYDAQAFAAVEAIVGVPYAVIVLSRLIGVHTARN